MESNDVLRSQTTVEELLQQKPETWAVFRKRHTNCVGCLMQRFCTLQDVAEAYSIPLQDLMDDLERQISSKTNAKEHSHENLDQIF